MWLKPQLKSICVKRLIGLLMKQGKLSKALRIISRCSKYIKEDLKKKQVLERRPEHAYLVENSCPIDIMSKGILTVKPVIEVKQTVKKKAAISILKESRGIYLACKWILEGARKRPERTMGYRLYKELTDASNKKGYAYKKKIEWHLRVK